MAAILLAGIVCYRQLAISDLPTLEYPTINVNAGLAGASPETMAATVPALAERTTGSEPAISRFRAGAGSGGPSVFIARLRLRLGLSAAVRNCNAGNTFRDRRRFCAPQHFPDAVRNFISGSVEPDRPILFSEPELKTMTVRFSALLPIATLLILGACKERSRPTPPAVPVTVAKAEERPVPFEITAPGTVEPIRAVSVASQVSGVITSVRFHEGDEVKQGQVLFQIDPRSYRNALQQAEAALARDVVQLANARRQVERYQSLAKSEYVTDEQYQALKANAEGLAATVKSDSAAVDNARLNLEYTTIRAPISGRTGSLLIKEGNLVRAPGTNAMVMLNQTKPIQVRFAVPASFLPEIRTRQSENLKVRVAPSANPQTALVGELAFVDNAVDTTTGTILLKGRFENTDGVLWPGQFVTATLVLYVQNSIVVPAPAVMNGDRGPYIFVIDPDQKATTRPIEVGRTVEDVVIVNQGITAGETVVTDGQLRLTPNARVDIKTDSDGTNAEGTSTNGAGGAPSRGRGGRGAGQNRGGSPNGAGEREGSPTRRQSGS